MSRLEPSRLRKVSEYVLYGLLLASVIVNVTQAARIRGLVRMIDPSKDWLAAGEPFRELSPIQVFNSRGSVSKDSRRTCIYYWFSIDCHWCGVNLPNLKALIANRSPQYELIGLAVDDAKLGEYLQTNALDFTVASLDRNDPIVRSLGGTPGTIMIGSDGKIAKVWRGAYDQHMKEEIEQSLSVSLPVAVKAPRSKRVP